MMDDDGDDDWDDDADHGFDQGADDGAGDGAVIPCPECGTAVDDDSPRCPACGHWFTAEEDPAPRRPLWVVITALVCLAVAVALAVLV